MKTRPIILTTVFCAAVAASLLHFAGQPANTIKILDRADTSVALLKALPDPSGKPNTTTIYKTNYAMPAELSEYLAKLHIDKARKEREQENGEIADIVKNQKVEPCNLPGRVRMEDGNCWLPREWKKLHP